MWEATILSDEERLDCFDQVLKPGQYNLQAAMTVSRQVSNAQAKKTWPIAYCEAFKEGKRDIVEWLLVRGLQNTTTLELQTILKGLT